MRKASKRTKNAKKFHSVVENLWVTGHFRNGVQLHAYTQTVLGAMQLIANTKCNLYYGLIKDIQGPVFQCLSFLI